MGEVATLLETALVDLLANLNRPRGDAGSARGFPFNLAGVNPNALIGAERATMAFLSSLLLLLLLSSLPVGSFSFNKDVLCLVKFSFKPILEVDSIFIGKPGETITFSTLKGEAEEEGGDLPGLSVSESKLAFLERALEEMKAESIDKDLRRGTLITTSLMDKN